MTGRSRARWCRWSGHAKITRDYRPLPYLLRVGSGQIATKAIMRPAVGPSGGASSFEQANPQKLVNLLVVPPGCRQSGESERNAAEAVVVAMAAVTGNYPLYFPVP